LALKYVHVLNNKNKTKDGEETARDADGDKKQKIIKFAVFEEITTILFTYMVHYM